MQYSEDAFSNPEVEDFIQNIDTSDLIFEELDKDITYKEVIDAIDEMKTNILD